GLLVFGAGFGITRSCTPGRVCDALPSLSTYSETCACGRCSFRVSSFPSAGRSNSVAAVAYPLAITCTVTWLPTSSTSILALPSGSVLTSRLPSSLPFRVAWNTTPAFSKGLPLKALTTFTTTVAVGGGGCHFRPCSWAEAFVPAIVPARKAADSAKLLNLMPCILPRLRGRWPVALPEQAARPSSQNHARPSLIFTVQSLTTDTQRDYISSRQQRVPEPNGRPQNSPG